MKFKLNNVKNSRWFNHPFVKKHVAKNSHLFKVNREAIARGVAIGLFVAILPILPFQTLLAILLSVAFRANLPSAFLLSWISNPFTIAPIAYFNYHIGLYFIKNPGMLDKVVQEMFWNFSYSRYGYKELALKFGKAYIIGLPIVGFTLAILGYLSVLFFWRFFTKKK